MEHELFLPFSVFQANRAMSERTSLSSRHRRKSVPSYSGDGTVTAQGGRRSQRGGSVDPLLDSDDSGGGHHSSGHHSRMHRSVSRGELDTHSVARLYQVILLGGAVTWVKGCVKKFLRVLLASLGNKVQTNCGTHGKDITK